MRHDRSPIHLTRVLAASAAVASLALGAVACSPSTGGSAAGSASATEEPAVTAPAATQGETTAQSPSASSAPATSPAASATASATELPLTMTTKEPAPALGWTSAATQRESIGSAGVETDLRFGVHDGYDRVVVEMSGDGAPGWLAQWVTSAATEGKGDPITVTGDRMLQVLGRGTTMPVTDDLAKVAYTGRGLHEVGGTAITQVWMDLTFEGQFQLVLGTTTDQYRVFTLSNPTRLVIDVKQP